MLRLVHDLCHLIVMSFKIICSLIIDLLLRPSGRLVSPALDSQIVFQPGSSLLLFEGRDLFLGDRPLQVVVGSVCAVEQVHSGQLDCVSDSVPVHGDQDREENS